MSTQQSTHEHDEPAPIGWGRGCRACDQWALREKEAEGLSTSDALAELDAEMFDQEEAAVMACYDSIEGVRPPRVHDPLCGLEGVPCPSCASDEAQADPDIEQCRREGHPGGYGMDPVICLRCGQEVVPAPGLESSLEAIVGWLEQQPGAEEALQAINAGMPAAEVLADYRAGQR